MNNAIDKNYIEYLKSVERTNLILIVYKYTQQAHIHSAILCNWIHEILRYNWIDDSLTIWIYDKNILQIAIGQLIYRRESMDLNCILFLCLTFDINIGKLRNERSHQKLTEKKESKLECIEMRWFYKLKRIRHDFDQIFW